jgi:protein TonB
MKPLITCLIIVFCAGVSWSQEEEFIVPPKEAQSGESPVAKPEIYTTTDWEAEFPGGLAAMKQYISGNIVYPQEAVKQKLQGKCYIRFLVTAEGKITNVQVIKGVTDCPECDAEAVRVVTGMPLWKPARNGSVAVHSFFNLPITFAL